MERRSDIDPEKLKAKLMWQMTLEVGKVTDAMGEEQQKLSSQKETLLKQEAEVDAKLKELQESKKEFLEQNKSIKQQAEEFEQKQKMIAALNVKPTDILKLNIGGTITQASRAVLCQVKGSKLETMFSGQNDSQLAIKDGEIFIDRNPQVFALLLDYLRNGCRSPPVKDPFIQESFQLELAYWQIAEKKDTKLEELKDIFKSIYLRNMDQELVDLWKKAGPFDLQAAIDSGKIKITQDLPIIKVELKPGFFYYGQTPTLQGSFIGKFETATDIDEGVFVHTPDKPCALALNGFGRFFLDNWYYEGEIKDGGAQGQGKRVKMSGEVKEGVWEDGKCFNWKQLAQAKK